jgi:hypothetical protein
MGASTSWKLRAYPGLFRYCFASLLVLSLILTSFGLFDVFLLYMITIVRFYFIVPVSTTQNKILLTQWNTSSYFFQSPPSTHSSIHYLQYRGVFRHVTVLCKSKEYMATKEGTRCKRRSKCHIWDYNLWWEAVCVVSIARFADNTYHPARKRPSVPYSCSPFQTIFLNTITDDLTAIRTEKM